MERILSLDDELNESLLDRRRKYTEWELLFSLGRHNCVREYIDRLRTLFGGCGNTSGPLDWLSYSHLCWQSVRQASIRAGFWLVQYATVWAIHLRDPHVGHRLG